MKKIFQTKIGPSLGDHILCRAQIFFLTKCTKLDLSPM